YGYGLTPEIVNVAAQMQPNLIITVDNGIASLDGVSAAKALGIKVLITDHHLPAAELPAADAIVNPNQPGCEFPSKNLAGVGVIFYVMTALRTALKNSNWFAEAGVTEPNMAELLDLVALGTVADVAVLDRNNRILVQNGVQRIRAGRCRPGITALLEVAKRLPYNIVANDLGFSVGPRLNAAGRLDDMTHGILTLLTDDPHQARRYAEELDNLNKDRRTIEQGMQQDAMLVLNKLQAAENELPYGLCLTQPEWHQGVIGILASRIKDKFNRPVIAFASVENDELKGSARSVKGVHIRDALDAIAARHPHLIKKFGGHAMAAGLTIKRQYFEEFRCAFDAEVRVHLSEHDLRGEVISDGELQQHEFELELAELLREAGPWGQGFPEPVFDGEFVVVQQRVLQDKHLKLTVTPKGSRRPLDAIAFNIDPNEWLPKLSGAIRMAFKLDVNEYRGQRTVQLMVEHLEPIL
ncbi:MAG TPA: single-stranded-DNA-specific exonuclease RecJ, partial [Pseudomonadales bacterium]|nr:single-stranded-DNA-specific exonuclease RecJ [Pseudomonadales bacterium]